MIGAGHRMGWTLEQSAHKEHVPCSALWGKSVKYHRDKSKHSHSTPRRRLCMGAHKFTPTPIRLCLLACLQDFDPSPMRESQAAND